jgi:hypothetical protein
MLFNWLTKSIKKSQKTLPKKVCKRLSNCVKGLYFAPLSEDVDKLIHHQTPVAYGQRPSSGYFS